MEHQHFTYAHNFALTLVCVVLNQFIFLLIFVGALNYHTLDRITFYSSGLLKVTLVVCCWVGCALKVNYKAQSDTSIPNFKYLQAINDAFEGVRLSKRMCSHCNKCEELHSNRRIMF